MIDHIRRHATARPALLEPATRRSVSHGELAALVDARARTLQRAAGGRALVFLAMDATIEAVLVYLACLRAELPVCLAEPEPQALARVSAAYAPALLALPESLAAPREYRPWDEASWPGFRLWRRGEETPHDLHPDLALLLTTSGSTGDPKLVRLGMRQLEANALAIAEYLDLGPGERAVQSLPTHYSYGLSVVNSHLVAGGSIALTPHSCMRPEFWTVVDELGCTSFAGVPYMYELLQRLRFAPERHPSLRTFTQAGGAWAPARIAQFHGLLGPAGRRLFVMYGQTEATARIAYVPPDRLADKLGSIGVAIPGGRLDLAPVEGTDGLTELVYEGPNVMLGYAESPADLAAGDVMQGRLRTGDLGRVDADGFFAVTGRLKRFAKLFGRRVSLDDVERHVEARAGVRAAALDGGDRLILVVAADGALDEAALQLEVAQFVGVPPAAVAVRRRDALPLTTAGKKDYRAIEAAAGDATPATPGSAP